MEDADFALVREAQRELAERRYAQWLGKFASESSVDFYKMVKIDAWSTVTIGEWGGYLIQIMPMTVNDRLVLTPARTPMVYDHGWCFDKGAAPMLAAMAWNPETQGEPVGFKKRATAGIRQPGERAAAEPRAFNQVAALMDLLEAATRRSGGSA